MEKFLSGKISRRELLGGIFTGTLASTIGNGYNAVESGNKAINKDNRMSYLQRRFIGTNLQPVTVISPTDMKARSISTPSPEALEQAKVEQVKIRDEMNKLDKEKEILISNHDTSFAYMMVSFFGAVGVRGLLEYTYKEDEKANVK